MLKAIIFDFDGVICNSERPRFEFYQKTFAKYGIEYSISHFREMVGIASVEFLSRLEIPGLTQEIKDKVYDEYLHEFRPHIASNVDPIEPVVSFIKGYNGPLKFAITSGSTYSVIEQVLTNFNIKEKFTAVLGREKIGRYKPFPDAYINAAKALGVQSDEYISIEDSQVGALAAIGAGANCFIVLNGVNRREEFEGIAIKGFIEKTEDFSHLFTV